MLRSAFGIGYGIAVAAFFSGIIGVFGLRVAIFSLVLYVTLSIAQILRKNRAES